MSKVFISYSTKDMKDAQMVLRELESEGIPCWIAPRDIPGGSDYTSKIPAAISTCQIMVLILSRNAENSNWVPLEMTRAINCRKMIIPFVVENYTLSDQFDFQLSLYQKYEAYENKQAVLAQMVERIRSLVGTESVKKPAAVQVPSDAVPAKAPAKVPAKAPAKPPAKTPKKTQAAAPADDSNIISGKVVNFKGVYRYAGKEGVQNYLRFFPNGKVAFAQTSENAQEVARWMGPNYPDCAEARFDDDRVEAEIILESGTRVTIKGHFENPTRLVLEVLKVGQKKWTNVGAGFCGLKFPTQYIDRPRLVSKFIQFYGLYQHVGPDGIRTYLRFFPDGRVAYAQASDPVGKVAGWMGPQYPFCAPANFHGDHFETEITLITGSSVKITGDALDTSRISVQICNAGDQIAPEPVIFDFFFLSFPKTYGKIPPSLTRDARYDGVYQRKLENGQLELIRMLPDDSAIYVRTSQTAEEAARWFGGKYPLRAKKVISGNEFYAEFNRPSQKKMIISGTISREKLQAAAGINGQTERENVEYCFTPICFPENSESVPAHHDSMIRYDGIYYEKDATGLKRFYRFFFPEKVVVSAISAAAPETVSSWLDRSYKNKGMFTLNGDSIEFTVRDSGKGTLKHRGTVRVLPFQMDLEIHASVSDTVFFKKLDFLPD